MTNDEWANAAPTDAEMDAMYAAAMRERRVREWDDWSDDEFSTNYVRVPKPERAE